MWKCYFLCIICYKQGNSGDKQQVRVKDWLTTVCYISWISQGLKLAFLYRLFKIFHHLFCFLLGSGFPLSKKDGKVWMIFQDKVKFKLTRFVSLISNNVYSPEECFTCKILFVNDMPKIRNCSAIQPKQNVHNLAKPDLVSIRPNQA